jgi:hypothetical protein
MKKICFLLYVILLVSCSTTITRDTVKKPLFEVLTQQSDGGQYQFYEILTEPNEICCRMIKIESKISTLMFKIKFCNFEYGRKITGGYAITIESVVETDKNIIYVKESFRRLIA